MLEIERKFLVSKHPNITPRFQMEIRQGYIAKDENMVVRVRIIDGIIGALTFKNKIQNDSLQVNDEIEFVIELPYALKLFELSKYKLYKTRYKVDYEGKIWDVDFFGGNLSGLVIAEIELKTFDEKFVLPPWVERELIGSQYSNLSLAMVGTELQLT